MDYYINQKTGKVVLVNNKVGGWEFTETDLTLKQYLARTEGGGKKEKESKVSDPTRDDADGEVDGITLTAEYYFRRDRAVSPNLSTEGERRWCGEVQEYYRSRR